jgi:phosphoribosylformimino-5-aminoimidazole carboxamide ribotide isomerase
MSLAFRPCIDLRDGKVVQIVGGTLSEQGDGVITNFTSDRSAAEFASLYRGDGLTGGHIIMLGPGNENAAMDALTAYPNGMQIGGGITPLNARHYLANGASHIIVTSYLFVNEALSFDRVKEMSDTVGVNKLVIDLSCRKMDNGGYNVAINKWQTITNAVLNGSLLDSLAPYCSEFLIHAADVEGKCQGIDKELVTLLGKWTPLPATYAGGAAYISDIKLVEELSQGKVDLTMGSALDIFGGKTARYADAVALGRKFM